MTDLFAGTWKMNPRKSNFDPNHRPTEGTMRFEAQTDGYLMRAEGVCDGKRVEEQPQRFMLDGVERPVPGAAGWQYYPRGGARGRSHGRRGQLRRFRRWNDPDRDRARDGRKAASLSNHGCLGARRVKRRCREILATLGLDRQRLGD